MQRRHLRSASTAVALVVTEIVIGAIVSVWSFLVFFKLASNIQSIQSIDLYISHGFSLFRFPILTSVMTYISYLGHEMLLILFIIAILILLFQRKIRDVLMFSFIFFAGSSINIFLKEFFSRDRPIDSVVQEMLHSFPSLHAMNSFVFYSLLVLYIYRISRNRLYTLVSFGVCTGIVLLVGVSRVYLGAHYLSDVIAGYVVGLWWVATVLVIDKTLTLFRLRNMRAT